MTILRPSGKLHYGLHDTPFGPALIGLADGVLARLSFCPVPCDRVKLEALSVLLRWPGDSLTESIKETAPVARMLDEADWEELSDVSLRLEGTAFQLRVWEAVRSIPPGQTRTYADLAERVGSPRAARAVGSAVGANPIAYFIPCHRVLRSNGALGGFRWGPEIKRAMLAREGLSLS